MRTCKDIDSWDWLYEFVRFVEGINFDLYFRKIQSVNKQELYKNKPLIIAPNHQNALIDALVFTSKTKHQVVFLARSDIFKGKTIKKILNFFKIMPVYRMRDGVENLKQNEAIFNKSMQVIHNKKCPLVVFPEGNHGNKRRLRPLQKGIFRIAFQAQEKYMDKPYVKILPAGIDYENYYEKGGTLLIQYGNPIDISKYYNDYLENSAKTINRLKKDLEKEMKKLIIHIRSEKYYDTIMALRQICNDEVRKHLGISGNKLIDRFKADKEMISRLEICEENDDNRLAEIDHAVKSYTSELEKLKISDNTVKKGSVSFPLLCLESLLLIILFPLHIFGMINNYIPYKLPYRFIKKIKDRQFHSSVVNVISLITFLVYYIILSALIIIFIPNLYVKIGWILSLAFTGKYTFYSYNRIKQLIEKFRFWKYGFTIKDRVARLKNLRLKIINTTKEILIPDKEYVKVEQNS